MSEGFVDFERLMAGVRQGSPEAVREFVERCGPHVLRIVRRRLRPNLRRRFDSTDFMQSVWVSFFSQARDERFKFDRPEALMTYLAQMAHNKVLDESYDQSSRKRDITRENSLDGSAAFLAGQVTSRLPTPSQVAVAQETYARLVDGLDERQREIILRLRQGHTHEEIAKEFGVSKKRVQRLVHKVMAQSEEQA